MKTQVVQITPYQAARDRQVLGGLGLTQSLSVLSDILKRTQQNGVGEDVKSATRQVGHRTALDFLAAIRASLPGVKKMDTHQRDVPALSPLWRHASRVILGVSIGLSGCASSLSSLPPLLVEPIPGDSSAYTFTPFRWKPGMRVVTRTTVLGEARVRDKTEHVSETSVAIEMAEQITARGLVQVQTLQDGKPFGSAFYDESGRLVDVSFSAPDAEVESILGIPLGATMLRVAGVRERLISRTLTRDDSVRFEMSISDWLSPEVKPTGEEPVTVSYTFVGYRRLNGRRVAEIRTIVDFPTTWVVVVRRGILSKKLGFRLEGSEFLAPESGLRVGASWTGTFAYSLSGEDVTGQATYRSTIDMRASKGIN